MYEQYINVYLTHTPENFPLCLTYILKGYDEFYDDFIRGSYMSVHVLLNLFNQLRKSDKM